VPQYVGGKLYDMHGEGVVPIGPALPFRGGIFGQPMLPQPRAGIFGSNWALPWQDQADNTIGPGHNLLPDRYMRSSGWPVYGLGTNGEETGLVLGPGAAVGPAALAPGGISGVLARRPLITGALVGMLLSPKGKRLGGAALGAVLGGFGRAAAESLPVGQPGLDPVVGAAGALAGGIIAGYLRRGAV
jgi:hypothetical protein